jgi:hypothetical protein
LLGYPSWLIAGQRSTSTDPERALFRWWHKTVAMGDVAMSGDAVAAIDHHHAAGKFIKPGESPAVRAALGRRY